MSRNRHNEGVDDFRQALAELIRLNDQRGGKHPHNNPASRPIHPKHQPVHANPYAEQNKPAMPIHVAGLPRPTAPPQYRHPTSRAQIPTRPSVGREEMFQRRMSSAMAQHSRNNDADDGGVSAQTSLFAGSLLVACCATFALVYYLGTDDNVTAASSHFQAPPTIQATSSISAPEASSNATHNNQVTSADTQALSDIANGNWVVKPSDVNQQIRAEDPAPVRQQTAGPETPGSAATRQQLFESFQSYLQETGLAPAGDSQHQEALFNSFVRWNVEVANAE